jgi:tRNA threonylcarbamoyl adenosine modification protein YeaZ
LALILNIETSTTVCSVALAVQGNLLSLKEENKGFTHAEHCTLFIETVLKEGGKSFSDLDAIAVSSGPGSYTGLRIGVSIAKGLCYGLEKPLIAVNTLKSLAHQFFLSHQTVQMQKTGKSAFPEYYPVDVKNVKKKYPEAQPFKQQPTEAEEVLWQELDEKKTGYKFNRQQLINQFIVDFVCISKKLIVEVDDEIHKTPNEYSEGKKVILEKLGFTVIRFKNEDVIARVSEVLQKIRSALAGITDLSPTHIPKVNAELKVREGMEHLPEGKDLGWVCPMIDARRMEVYCAIYDSHLNEIQKSSAQIIDKDAFSDLLATQKIYFFGDGAEKCKVVLAHQPNAVFIDDIIPSSTAMITLSEEKFQHRMFENVAMFEPFYLKEFYDDKKSNH